MSVLLGLDVGTTGVRVVAIDEAGTVVAEASESCELSSPRPGWAEQDPADWWSAARMALRTVASQVGERVAGLGLTGQMHGSVFLDAEDRVIRPALLWNDQRTEAQCREITERVGKERLLSLAGNPALTGFQAPKLLWLRENEPESYARVRRLLLPKDYVRLLLAGEYATDASDASGTLLLDVGRREWSEEILQALEIPTEWLPRVYEGPEAVGQLRSGVAAELGLPAGVPVAAGGGDNAAAAVGTGIVREGLMSSSIGTSGVLFAHTEEFRPDPSGRVHAFCHAVPGKYHLMGVTLSAGGSLAWWRDVLGRAEYEELTRAAGEVPPGSEGLLFLPYLTGERTPHLDPAARGAFFGLTTRHRRAHLTRAVMEGVTLSLRDALEVMRELGVRADEIRVTGGGARSMLWRSLQANIYSSPVRRTVAEEGPAYGAALLAGVAAGVYRDVDDAASRVELQSDITDPDPAYAGLYDRMYDVYRSLYPTTRDAMRTLSDLAQGGGALDG